MLRPRRPGPRRKSQQCMTTAALGERGRGKAQQVEHAHQLFPRNIGDEPEAAQQDTTEAIGYKEKLCTKARLDMESSMDVNSFGGPVPSTI